MDGIRQVAKILQESQRVLFITGAGISADSGIPTYRGIGGLYNDDDAEAGMKIEEILSGPMIRKNPELCWKHLSRIEQACRGAKHNKGHEIIAQLQDSAEVWILTQNVDGFHTQAGSKNVIDIHGDLHNLYCTECDYREYFNDFSALPIPPQCPKCSKIVRPDVVFFEEMLPMQKIDRFHQEMEKGFDLVFSIGTSSLFPYIVQPIYIAKHWGIPTVEINPSTTELSSVVDIKITSTAAKAMEAIWNQFLKKGEL